MTRTQAALAAGSLAVALAVLYWPHITHAGFVYEDHRMLDHFNRALWPHGLTVGRGLSSESWTLIRTPHLSHALNVGLHVVAVLLTGLLLWQLTRDVFTAWAVAAVMALHPVTIEGVAYATSRADLIAAVGVLVVLVCATAPSPWTWAVLPWGLAVAYGGKETGLVGLALVPLALWLQGQRAWAYRGAALVASLSVGFVLLHPGATSTLVHLGNDGPRQVDGLTWIAVQAAAVGRLVMLSLAPFWLSVSPAVDPLHGLPWVAALIFGLALVEVTWRLSSSAPLAAFGLIGSAIVVAPRFFVRTPDSPFNEHQWYLAMPFVACTLTAGLIATQNWWDRQRPPIWRAS